MTQQLVSRVARLEANSNLADGPRVAFRVSVHDCSKRYAAPFKAGNASAAALSPLAR